MSGMAPLTGLLQLCSFASFPTLYTLFAPLSPSPCCPLIYFSSSEFVARGDIFLYLPDTSPAAHPDEFPPPFRITPPIMRSSMLLVPPVHNINKPVTHGEPSFSMLVLSPLINIFLSIAHLTTAIPLLLSTICTQ